MEQPSKIKQVAKNTVKRAVITTAAAEGLKAAGVTAGGIAVLQGAAAVLIAGPVVAGVGIVVGMMKIFQ